MFFYHQYLWNESIYILDFLHFLHFLHNHQGKLGSETTTFGYVWPVVALIQSTAGFCDHQYLRKWVIDILVILHSYFHQGKLTSEATTIGWLWPGVSLVESNFRIFLFSISLEGINSHLRFYARR